jgi:SAM-dependent methyltransferase
MQRVGQPSPCRLRGTAGEHRVVLKGVGKHLRKCASCGVVFLDPPPSDSEMDQHFSTQYIRDDDRLENNFGKRRDEVLSLVASEIQTWKASGTVLDVGCAGGYFLNRYFDQSRWNRYGVEPSRYAAEKAGQRLAHVYRGALKNINLPAETFDVITVLDVLYYFTNPHEELRVLSRALKKDGSLVIAIPLAGTQLFRHATKAGRFLGRKSYSLLNNGHLFFFSMRSVSLLLRETGFQVTNSIPLPGNRWPTQYQNILYRSYYSASKLAWYLTAKKLMFGPNCMIVASPASPCAATSTVAESDDALLPVVQRP